MNTRSCGPSGPAAEALSATGVSKRYGGVQALDGAELRVVTGEVHAILGENGAGKSTLVKIIAGIVPLDAGTVRAMGSVLVPGSPQGARDAGIAVVYQELSLIPQLSVAHNLLLTRLPKRAKLVSVKTANRIAQETLANLNLDDIDPRSPVAELPLDQQQMIEIAKATMVRPKILVLDEATSSLGSAEVDRLFQLVRGLRDLGTTVVVITHRMREVWALADAMTILRDGRTVGRSEVGAISQREAISLMAGRDIRTIFPEKPRPHEGAPALELRDVRLRPHHRPWSLQLRRQEILGLGGLEGQGQRELLTWLYGSGRGSGAVVRDGRPLRVRNPTDALRQGIVLIPEDRKAEGLHLELPVRWNLAMATIGQRSRYGFIRMRAEREFTTKTVEELKIKLGSPFAPASALSGGTQQKVVIGKFMARHPSVLLFVDPTRGIDVETKFNFYEMIRDLARSGAACVLYSSDTEELVGLCDRVVVFHDGVPVSALEGDEITQDAVVAASFAVAGEGGVMVAPDAAIAARSRPGRPHLPWQRSYTAAILALGLLVLDIIFSGGTLSSIQVLGVTNQALPLALVAVGETLVILTNGIDLSVGGVIAVANVTTAVLAQHGFGDEGILVALAAGLVAGLVNGLIVNYARIAPLIATLATSSIFFGIALIILPLPGGSVPGWLPGWTSGALGSVPVSAIWLAVSMVAGWALLRRTQFGVNLQALGGSEPSSWSAGIRVVRVRTLAYVLSGACAALAGVVLAGLTQSGDPTIGAPYLLDTIAAVVIGGTSLFGGVGTVVGSVLGATALSLVSAVLLTSGLSTYIQYLVSGGIVIGALLVQARMSKIRAKRPVRSRRLAPTAVGSSPT